MEAHPRPAAVAQPAPLSPPAVALALYLTTLAISRGPDDLCLSSPPLHPASPPAFHRDRGAARRLQARFEGSRPPTCIQTPAPQPLRVSQGTQPAPLPPHSESSPSSPPRSLMRIPDPPPPSPTPLHLLLRLSGSSRTPSLPRHAPTRLPGSPLRFGPRRRRGIARPGTRQPGSHLLLPLLPLCRRGRSRRPRRPGSGRFIDRRSLVPVRTLTATAIVTPLRERASGVESEIDSGIVGRLGNGIATGAKSGITSGITSGIASGIASWTASGIEIEIWNEIEIRPRASRSRLCRKHLLGSRLPENCHRLLAAGPR